MIKDEKITVYINDVKKIVFSGLRIRDILSLEQLCDFNKGKLVVKDSYGHIVGLDGAIMSEERYALIYTRTRLGET